MANSKLAAVEGWFKEAVKDCGLPEVEHALARWYKDQADLAEYYGNLESAVNDYLKAAALLGDHFGFRGVADRQLALNVCMCIASAMLRQRRHAEAKAYFRKALELFPNNPDVQDGGGENVIRHGTAAEIREYFEAVLAANPQSRMARFALDVARLFPGLVDDLMRRVGGSGRTAGTRAKAIVVMPLWGDAYLKLFRDYTLPILLGPGNLPALAEHYDPHFVIFTTEACRRALENDTRFAALGRLMPCHIVPYPDELMSFSDHHVGRFQLLQLAHYVALEGARRLESDVVFVFPDNIVNDGFYRALGPKMAKASVKAVACAGFRLYVGDILPAIDANYRGPDGSVSVPASGIVRLLVDHLDDTWYVDSSRFAVSPFFLCWRMPGEGILVRATHFQPYAIRARYLNKPLFPCIDPVDAQFMYRHFDDCDGIELVGDTEMCALDAGASPILDPYKATGSRYFDEVAFARFIHTYDTPLHRQYLRRPIRLALDPTRVSAQWERAVAEGGQMIERVFQLIDGFDQMAPTRPAWAVEADRALFKAARSGTRPA